MLGIVEVRYFPPLNKSNLQSAFEGCIDTLLNKSHTSELGPESGIEVASIRTGSEHIDITAPVHIPIPVSVSLPVPISPLDVSAVTSDDANKSTSLSISVNSAEEVTDNAEQVPVNSEESVAPPEPMFR